MTQIKNPLYGLILAGGYSKRMGRDKAQIVYHGRPQVQIARELCAAVCEKTFVSLRPDQVNQPCYAGLTSILDDAQYEGKGPLGGILTAMSAHPQASWLVLACDLPFMNAKAVDVLLKHRDPYRFATAFQNPQDGLPEPLAAIWEAGSYTAAASLFQGGITCPRKVLIKNDTLLVQAEDPKWVDNINTLEEYRRAAPKS